MFYKDKLAVVTGGTGFVGTHIVQELLKRGARVRVPVHARPLALRDGRIETVKADLNVREDCLLAVKGADFVFHAAGAVAGAAVTAGNPLESIIVNLQLTGRVLQAAWDAGVGRTLIFSSSTGYPAADHPVKEDEMWSGPPHPVYAGYGWMRRYVETLGAYVAAKSGMKVAIVRPTAVYGRQDNFDPKASHVVPALIRRAVAKEDPFVVWGTGEEVRDFLHITDLARACLLMLEKCADCDPVNIGCGKAVTVKEITGIILAAAGHAGAKVVFDPSKPATIPFRMVDTSKAKRILGFEPEMGLERGLKDTVEWYKSEKRL